MRKGFAFILLFILVLLVFIIVGAFLVLKNIKNELPNTSNIFPAAEKQWTGLILTKEGFIKINSEGVFERKDLNSKPTIYPIPNVNKDFSAYNPYYVREDGNIAIIGNPELSPNFQRNKIYAWKIDSKEDFKPVFSAPYGQIHSFEFSPNNKQIAINFITVNSEEEVLKSFGKNDFSNPELAKALKEREDKFQEELRTITIYDVGTANVIQTLKLKQITSPSRRISSPGLEWKKNVLSVRDIYEITIFDPNTWEIKQIIGNDEAVSGRLVNKRVIISPDGTKYYNSKTFEVKTIPDNKSVAKFKPTELIDNDQAGNGDEAINLGPASFSFDSNKIILATQSIRGFDFIIWELDIKTGLTKKIARLNNVNYGLKPEDQKTLWLSYNFQFIGYTPTSEKIFFTIFAENNERTGARLDYFTIKPGDSATDYHEGFWEVSTWADLEKVSGFGGWYKSD